MAINDDFVLYGQLSEDIDKVKELNYGSEEWKRVQDSIDKRYNTTLAEAKLGADLAERDSRIELEKEKFEKETELRQAEINARIEIEKEKLKNETELREAERDARLELEKEKFDKEAELREMEAEVADKKSRREFIGKLLGIGAGILVVFGKIIYDNSDAITDKFTLDAGSKMISNK